MAIEIIEGDCLEVMKEIPDQSIDMVLCDLPYGTTQNKWDSVLPLDALWAAYWRVCKPNAALVFTAAMPFTASLVSSRLQWFKHSLVFEKSHATGHLNANRAPMRKHEDVVVFCRGALVYNPQKQPKPKENRRPATRGTQTESYGGFDPAAARTEAVDVSFPSSIIRFNTSSTGSDKGLHPTQKPVPLFEYLIRTYTNEGDTVLDNTMGSGTTGVACLNTGRNFIGIEKDPIYFGIAERRLGFVDEPAMQAAE